MGKKHASQYANFGWLLKCLIVNNIIVNNHIFRLSLVVLSAPALRLFA